MSEPCRPPLLSLEPQGVTQGVPKGALASCPAAAPSLAVSLPWAVSPQEQCQGQEEQRQRGAELGSTAAVLGVFLGNKSRQGISMRAARVAWCECSPRFREGEQGLQKPWSTARRKAC